MENINMINLSPRDEVELDSGLGRVNKARKTPRRHIQPTSLEGRNPPPEVKLGPKPGHSPEKKRRTPHPPSRKLDMTPRGGFGIFQRRPGRKVRGRKAGTLRR